MTAKPLFIPLHRKWFEAFREGTKTEEWRRYGPGWNERNCFVGRGTVLSLGYSRTRLRARVTEFRTVPASGPAAELYGEGTLCAVIRLELLPD